MQYAGVGYTGGAIAVPLIDGQREDVPLDTSTIGEEIQRITCC